jgi:putative holliday junction resolvase
MKARRFIALDVGEKRIGVAVGDDAVRIAVPIDTVSVDGSELTRILEHVIREKADKIIIGYPRNQAGEPTAQTAFVEEFAARLTDGAPEVVFQDESLTSVYAEQNLKATGKPYQKSDIDANAAALILQDYLEAHT